MSDFADELRRKRQREEEEAKRREQEREDRTMIETQKRKQLEEEEKRLKRIKEETLQNALTTYSYVEELLRTLGRETLKGEYRINQGIEYNTVYWMVSVSYKATHHISGDIAWEGLQPKTYTRDESKGYKVELHFDNNLNPISFRVNSDTTCPVSRSELKQALLNAQPIRFH